MFSAYELRDGTRISDRRRSPIVASHGSMAPDSPTAGDWLSMPGLSSDRHRLLAPRTLAVDTVVRRSRVPIATHPHDDESLVLVRPDGYIGFSARPADPGALADYLDRTFG